MKTLLLGMLFLGATGMALQAGGCWPTCELVAAPGIDVTVQDSVTGALVVGQEILAIATTVGYADTIQRTRLSSRLFMIDNRPGIYSLEISVPGYEVWRLEGIDVQMGRCTLRTVEVTAKLQPVAL